MTAKKFGVVAIIFLFVLLSLGSLVSEGQPWYQPTNSLEQYLPPDVVEHLKILGYRTPAQFVALANSNRGLLEKELASQVPATEMNQILAQMQPAVQNIGWRPVYPWEQPVGLMLDRGFQIIRWQELLNRYGIVIPGFGEVNNIPYCNSIKRQGDRGTCVAFGSVAFLEFEFVNHKGFSRNLDLSEQYFFWACKERDGMPWAEGTNMEVGRDVMKYEGTCREVTWPYSSIPSASPGQGPPPLNAGSEAKEYVYTNIEYIGSTYALELNDIKESLRQKHIVVFAVPVFSSWYYSEETKRTGEITMPLKKDGTEGGHCMVLVGYKDDKEYPGGGYFIVRNSWGTEWAYQSRYGAGYGTIPYAYLQEYWYGGWIAS